jgi:hypothetical protein
MDCTQDLYCSPVQDDRLYPQTQYTLAYNPQFGSLQGARNVDLYLYQSDQQGINLIEKVSGLPNQGQFQFTIDQVCLWNSELTVPRGGSRRPTRQHKNGWDSGGML